MDYSQIATADTTTMEAQKKVKKHSRKRKLEATFCVRNMYQFQAYSVTEEENEKGKQFTPNFTLHKEEWRKA